MNWDDLRFVLAVARAASIAGAARQLGVSHSTVYRRVKAFEEEHEVSCFERLADGMRLTDAGRALLEPIGRVEASVLAVERSLSQHEDEVSGVVTVAAPEALGANLCARLGPLLRRFPRLVIAWKIGAEATSLQRGEADLALRVTNAPDASLVGRKVGDLAFAIYASRAYLAEHPFTAVAAARWVVFGESAAHTPQGRWEQSQVPAERVVMRVDGRGMLDVALVAGHGVGITACALGDQEPSLVRLSEPLDALRLPLWLLGHATMVQVPRVRAVMDACVELLLEAGELMAGTGITPG